MPKCSRTQCLRFDPSAIAERLEEEVTNAVKCMLVEHGYVDKDYRSQAPSSQIQVRREVSPSRADGQPDPFADAIMATSPRLRKR